MSLIAPRSAPALLAECSRLGVALAAKGDRLIVDAPSGLLGPGFLDDLRLSKPELLTLLVTRPPTPPDPDMRAMLADRTIGVARPDPPRGLDDLAGKPLDYWRHLVGNWGDTSWLAWNLCLGRRRTGIEGPDDLDLLERRAFDSVLSLPETVDPRPPMEVGAL